MATKVAATTRATKKTGASTRRLVKPLRPLAITKHAMGKRSYAADHGKVTYIVPSTARNTGRFHELDALRMDLRITE